MELDFITEGQKFTIYGMRAGEGVKVFMAGLYQTDIDEYSRLDRRLTQLAERGASRNQTEFNDLGHGLFEMKTRGGIRIVFFYDAGHLIICTQGFPKKSRKTPKKELDVARKRKAEYERFKKSGGRFGIHGTALQKEPKRKP